MADGTLDVEGLVARANRILKLKREDEKVVASWVPRFKKRLNMLSLRSTRSVTGGIGLDPE
ncbi:hypothetical protein PR003_g4873 [Phytophthora rubi]|uniref:Uncharacterized protein n=1 Tax=Phytophthora rubi TaxID=129364 RepID=A0A6A3NZU4_9STRA|nr:hypothetical protein PR001_g4519 [Phytophthora rubi]KAE9351463.1 hypothetical protein PR003_g4873 [Phytophthora rubi]